MGLVLVGASLQASASTVPHLVIGRVVTGFGTGIDSSTVPMYQSELCRKERRGRLVSWEVLFIGIGITGAYWIDYGFAYVSGSTAWRTPIALQMVFAIIVVFLLFGLPESPRWLCKQGREEEAIEVLCAVFDLPADDDYVVGEIRGIRRALALEREGGEKSWWSIFKKDKVKTRRRVALAWFVLVSLTLGFQGATY